MWLAGGPAQRIPGVRGPRGRAFHNAGSGDMSHSRGPKQSDVCRLSSRADGPDSHACTCISRKKPLCMPALALSAWGKKKSRLVIVQQRRLLGRLCLMFDSTLALALAHTEQAELEHCSSRLVKQCKLQRVLYWLACSWPCR